MNHHYPYPPPGLVYYPPHPPPPGPPPPAASQYGAQILPPPGLSLNLNGHHPHPHLHIYAAPQNTMRFPQPNSYHVDMNGWYTPTHPQPPPPSVALPRSPMYPPGLALPTRAASAASVVASTTGTLDVANMDEYWAGRLAPLPGYQSPPILLPMRGKTPPVESQPIKKQELAPSPRGLLPPHSFFGSSYEREIVSPSTTSEKTLIDEKKDNEKAVDTLIKLSPSPTSTKNDENKLKKEFQLDKYADSFIPQYLYKIQKETHPLKPLPPIPVFPSLSYLQTFLIPKLIKQSTKNDIPSLLRATPIQKDAQPTPLGLDTYHDHWTQILRWELDAVAHDKEQIVLWKLVPKVAVWKEAEFLFSVPGIRENHPHLEVGDLVHMREVLASERRGSQRALEGRVVGLVKREGLVRIRSAPLKEHVQTYVPLALNNIKTENGFVVFGADEIVPFTFNVSFMTNAGPLCTMQTAVATVANLLSEGGNLAKHWIFPDVRDFIDAECVVLRNGTIQEEQWVDAGLNAEQRLAVTSIALYQSPVPRLISGPPGTGKTRTVVEAVLQIFRVQPEACILVCAPSNPATDTLALRLLHNLLQHEMLRLNDPNRTFAEVPDTLKPYCYVEDNKFALPPWKQLMKYRVIVTSCLDAAILVRAQCTNTTLMAMEEEVVGALHPHRPQRHIVQPHWTHLLIDEAAQGSEPELAVPISVVLPEVCEEVGEGRFVPQLALCGDINQLGPNVVSNEARAAGFEISLLERLLERPLYSKFVVDVSSQLTEDDSSLPYTSLVKNYRSHPVILMPPSALFYNDTLVPSASANGKIVWSGLPKPHLPLKFIGTDAVELSNDDRASWFNPGQINIVVEVIKSLLENQRLCEPPLRPGEIAVMAPWRQQVWAMRKRLRDEKYGAVDVGTVEDYQGRESRVVIISCVRSSTRFLEEDYKKGMGFMMQRKRMNVAITRAKELLIVIGNGTLLQRDPYWKSFLQFTIRNGLYEGPELSLEMDGSYISRLESTLIHLGDYTLDPEQEGLMIAGGVAREVLRE